METITFSELKNNAERFFEILPQDWQAELVPFWNHLKTDAKIYILENKSGIIGGGVVFYRSPPDFAYFEKEATDLFRKGYLYLGFIWIAQSERNKNLGSFWLNQLKAQNIQQQYFLLTEEDHLRHFYEKNDFSRIKLIQNQNNEEWLYLTKVNDSKQT